MLKNLILLGPQGSGKGTQAELLSEKFGYVYIGAGDSLREIAKEDSDLGRQVKATIEAGHLVDPELMAQVIKEKVLSVSANSAVIIDGFPRNLLQFGMLEKFWASLGRGDYEVLLIDLPEDETVKRLSLRASIEKRGDDTPEGIRRRLHIYQNETRPMLEKMRRAGKTVIEIDGRPSIEDVHREILEKLQLK